MLDTEHKYTLTYFVPGRFALAITHPKQSRLDEEQVGILIEEATEVLHEIGYQDAYLEKSSEQNFPSVLPDRCYPSELDSRRRPKVMARDEFSLIFMNARNVITDPIEFFKLVIQVEERLPERLRKRNREDDGRRLKNDGLKLRSVVLDWVTSGSQVPGSTGGPGSWPVPYRGAPDRAPYKFHFLAQIESLCGSGEGVDVFILDTLPQGRKTDHADAEAVNPSSVQQEARQLLDTAYNNSDLRHSLIHSLLRPNDSPLELRAANPDFLPQIDGEDLKVIGHDYEMTDHGVFAAGIVHTIAPCAKIYLIQVLNRYGVGSLESVIEGLKHVERLHDQHRKLVVNCSFTINIPLELKHRCSEHEDSHENCFVDIYTPSDRKLEMAICKKIEEDPSWLKNQQYALEHPCEVIHDTLQSRVIAAAGNDRRPESGGSKPRARLLAALDSVQGVGALPREVEVAVERLKTSSYSNLADQPQEVGIVTLGGEPGEGQGVLGLYLGEFPSCEKNCTKWAWWAGTSFAAPIVSGVVAALLSDRPAGKASLTQAQQALEVLYGKETPIAPAGPTLIGDEGTTDMEDVLWVTQGYSAEPMPIPTSTTPPSR